MKAKSLLIAGLGAAAIATFNTSCQRSAAANTEARMVENGAQFKKGEGLSLTDEMSQSIGLKVEDVAEEKVGASTALELTVVDAHTATAWISPEEVGKIASEMRVLIQNGGTSIEGSVERVDPAAVGGGDAEIFINTESELSAGSPLKATIARPAGDAVAAIPASALLRTAEGTFAYTVNGKFFVRTPVTVGATNDRLVEITDGLYAGDQVVTTPVMSLWMAELQVLRGGKACTCGH